MTTDFCSSDPKGFVAEDTISATMASQNPNGTKREEKGKNIQVVVRCRYARTIRPHEIVANILKSERSNLCLSGIGRFCVKIFSIIVVNQW